MKHMKEYLFLVVFALSSTASAIVIRDDTEDEKYQVPASALPALADFPGEGHGVLISPQWVVTAAHVACMQHHVPEIVINGLSREVESVVVHSGYKTPPQALIKETLASGDGSELRAFLASSDDIALVKLKAPVSDVKPISLYRGRDEIGSTVKLIGKGATGSGSDGPEPHAPHRTSLRRAFNVISSVDTRWISYSFDPPESAVQLEGMSGNGDSGGPVLIREQGQWQLAGLVAWETSQRDLRMYHGARYGDGGNNVRISHYIEWIESTIAVGAQRQSAALPEA
ncbi:S1 family peptidase [Microbulbifer yueqingensis]|uniref:Trypsin n=1 Tax=Microbulbifer yueqingensis TaxID=658219 RepID=A0A1G9D2S5_9GAMM|nr:trypsin-like serine protease [Microbulbifer yueqingensis]SDK58230.1 Trypsin [Microbulbifer yueqingensis]